MAKTICGVCGSERLRVVLMDHGPHYAKRVCPDGHFVEWVARPREESSEIPPELAELIVTRDKPASLKGTPNQVAAARMIRSNMVSFANKAGREDFTRLLVCINDATWFLANKGTFPPTLKRWPRAEQLEQAKEGVAKS